MSSADANKLDQIVNALKHSVTFILHRYSEGVADQLQFVREIIEGATRIFTTSADSKPSEVAEV